MTTVWILNQDQDISYKYDPIDNMLGLSYCVIGNSMHVQLHMDDHFLGDFDTLEEGLIVMQDLKQYWDVASASGLPGRHEYEIPGFSDYDEEEDDEDFDELGNDIWNDVDQEEAS